MCDKQMQPVADAPPPAATSAAAADVADDEGMDQRLPDTVGSAQGAVGGAEFRPRGISADVLSPQSRQVLLKNTVD